MTGSPVSTGPVLITGGAGFIGSNLADAVIARGRACHVVDNLHNGRRENVPDGASFHQIDIRDVDDLAKVVEESGARTIFHLAAQADVRVAVDRPTFDADVNILGTIAVLEAARRHDCAVLFASTGGAGYGEYDGLAVPSPETAETRPLSPYGASKMAAEGYLGMYGRLHGLKTLSLRLGNVYGPRQDPHGEAGVVAIFCGKLLDGEPPRVFGDGLQTRDYVYVGDVVDAFLAGEERMPSGETINIGCSEEVTVIDLVDGLRAGEPVFEPARAGELQRSALANDKAAQLLDWQPETALGDGLMATLESVRAHRENPGSRAPGALEVASAEMG